MTNIRVFHNKDNPYVQLNKKTLEISSLSWEAKGLWAYLLSRPDDWTTNVKQLIKAGTCSRDKIHSILKELKEHSLCKYVQSKKNGEWSTGDYLIFESSEEFKKCLPYTDLPFPVKPDVYKELYSTKKDIPKGISKVVAIAPSPPSFSSDVERLCKHLIKKIQSHGVKFKDPRDNSTTWNQWQKEMDKLLRLDTHSPLEILSLIDFAHDDDFWCQNILSPTKLRKHSEKLLLQKTQKEKKPSKEDTEEKNKTYAEEVVKTLRKNVGSQDLKIELCSSYLEIGSHNHPQTTILNYSEKGFRSQLDNQLRKMNLTKYLT